MIDRKHDLPVKRQAELVGISRGSVYYLPTPVSAADLTLMRVIDPEHRNQLRDHVDWVEAYEHTEARSLLR